MEKREKPNAIYVDPLNLTEVAEWIQTGLDISVVAKDEEFAKGVQEAADIWSLHVDLADKDAFPLLDEDAIQALADKYDVSAQALTFRLAYLGHIQL